MQITCSCGKRLRVSDEAAGKRIQCPACGKKLLVEEAPPPSPLKKRAPDDRPAVPATGGPAKRRAPAAEEEDEPRPRKKGRKKKARGPSPYLWLGLGGGAAILAAVALVLLFVFNQKPKDGPGGLTAGTPAGGAAGPTTPSGLPATTGARALTNIEVVAYSPDGKRMAIANGKPRTGAIDHFLGVWDLAADKEEFALDANKKDGTRRLAFSPDGQLLASSCQGEIKVWDLTTHAARWTLTINEGVPRVGQDLLAFSPDGKYVVSIMQGQVVLLDVATGKDDRQGLFFNQLSRAACSPVAPVVAAVVPSQKDAGGVECSLAVYDYQKKSLQTVPVASYATAVAFSGDGGTFVLASAEGPIEAYDTKTWKKQASLDRKRTETAFMYFDNLVVNADGTAVYANPLILKGGEGVEAWAVGASQETRKLRLKGNAMALAPDGKTLALADFGGPLKFLDPATGQEKAPGPSAPAPHPL